MNQPKQIEVTVRAYGILRDRLKDATHGRGIYQLEEPATIADLLVQLGLALPFQFSVNGTLVHDQALPLADGDTVEVFRSAAGG